ncbi:MULTISPECIES: hypothetical protein [unclassified Vibrio]|uniref:hypothetical protein n=1 Tax=unclassified Vibrio TaxID=2614977 RepID=UPI00354BC713
MDYNELEAFSQKADEYLLSGKVEELTVYLEQYADKEHEFESVCIFRSIPISHFGIIRSPISV